MAPHQLKAATTEALHHGGQPASRILALANDRVIVTGYVPDTAPYLQKCRVSIAPLRYGAGMKGKVGEALACGLPVVASSIAVEGTDLQSGRNVIVADDPVAFADAAIALYQNEELWNRISINGKEFVTKLYSPEAVAANLEDCPVQQPLSTKYLFSLTE